MILTNNIPKQDNPKIHIEVAKQLKKNLLFLATQ